MRTCLHPSAVESVQVPPPLRDAAHNALRETTRNLPCGSCYSFSFSLRKPLPVEVGEAGGQPAHGGEGVGMMRPEHFGLEQQCALHSFAAST